MAPFTPPKHSFCFSHFRVSPQGKQDEGKTFYLTEESLLWCERLKVSLRIQCNSCCWETKAVALLSCDDMTHIICPMRLCVNYENDRCCIMSCHQMQINLLFTNLERLVILCYKVTKQCSSNFGQIKLFRTAVVSGKCMALKTGLRHSVNSADFWLVNILEKTAFCKGSPYSYIIKIDSQ